LVLEATIPYQINRLGFLMNQLLENDLQKNGLSTVIWRVMAVLEYNSHATVNQLAEYAMVDQSTVSRLIQRMVRDGDIENQPSDADGRMRKIVLTKQGKKRYALVKGRTMQHVSRILEGVSRDERTLFLELLMRMQNNVETRTLDD
jgi:DNA-binding MarR family transcriptional regulator